MAPPPAEPTPEAFVEVTAVPAPAHVCRVVDDPADVAGVVRAHLAAAVTAGWQPVVLAPPAGSARVRALTGAVCAAGPVPVPVPVTVPALEPGDLDGLGAALADANAAGRAGVHAVALLVEPGADGGRALGGWDHLLGGWQSTVPVALPVMLTCVADRRGLGEKLTQELACLHPRVAADGVAVPFRLYHRGGRLTLDGEVDTFSAPLLGRALAHVRPDRGERLVVDARGLDFLNHRGVVALVEGLARRCPAGVTLAGAPAVPTRLLESLGVAPEVLDVLPSPW